MSKSIPIESNPHVELLPGGRAGVRRVKVLNPAGKRKLTWDRFVRLNAAAEAIRELVPPQSAILDVGGFDGALALFLNDLNIDLIDPATTGSCILSSGLPEKSYLLCAAIDILEHIEPESRHKALSSLTQVSQQFVILNYPCSETRAAQELVFKITGNALVKEHVDWELPDTDEVVQRLDSLGFDAAVYPHSSVAVWIGQYIVSNLNPQHCDEINSFLIDNHAIEAFDKPLYHLLVCKRR